MTPSTCRVGVLAEGRVTVVADKHGCPLPTCSGYRFPTDVIHRAVWMYLRFTLSCRDVEEPLPERGIQVTYEAIRRWVHTFGPPNARQLRAKRPAPHGRVLS